MRLAILVLLSFASVAVAAEPPATRPTTQPTFIELPKMELGGIATFGNPQGGLFGRLWDKFPGNVENQPGVTAAPYVYGVSLDVPTNMEKREWCYVAAAQITDPEKAPLHLVRVTVPAGTYAVFRLSKGIPEGLPEFGPMFDRIFKAWFPTSGYVLAAPLNVERYNVEQNTIEILIPVKKK